MIVPGLAFTEAGSAPSAGIHITVADQLPSPDLTVARQHDHSECRLLAGDEVFFDDRAESDKTGTGSR